MQDKPKPLDQVRDEVKGQALQYPHRAAYLDWIKRFILFHDNAFSIRIVERMPVRAIRRMAYWTLG